MPSVFSQIIAGTIPAFKISENEQFLAFLDIQPLREGHVLIVPKLEVDKVYDLPDEYLSQLFLFAKPIAAAMERAFPCTRVGISFIGLEVPHAHMHLVPIDSPDDLNFTRKPLQPAMDELAAVQQRLLAELI